MFLSVSDEVLVLQRCHMCGGTKEAQGTDGNTSQCTNCDEQGKVVAHVPMREFVNFVGEEMAKQIRLRGGLR